MEEFQNLRELAEKMELGFKRGVGGLAGDPETQKIFCKDRDRELGVRGTSEGEEGNLC